MASGLAAQHASASPLGNLGVVLGGLAGAALIAAVGTRLSHAPGARAASGGGLLAATGNWLARARDRLALRTHPAVAATLALTAGLAAAVAVTYVVGLLAKTPVIVHLDRPVGHFVDGHRIALISRLMLTGTLLGGYVVVYTIAITAGLLVGVLSGRWLPLIMLVAAVPTEKLAQQLMGTLVHGSPPPQALAIGPPGGYFSGGSARVLIVCGLLAYFLTWAGAGRRNRGLLWMLVVLATFAEGYSRLYLGRHWAVDILGGWVLGGLVLASFVFAAEAMRPSAGSGAAARSAAATPATSGTLDGRQRELW